MLTDDNNRASGLVRGLGLWAATAVIVGCVIGQAVFLVTSDIAREVGSAPKLLLVWLVGGVIVLFGALRECVVGWRSHALRAPCCLQLTLGSAHIQAPPVIGHNSNSDPIRRVSTCNNLRPTSDGMPAAALSWAAD
jgi:hypothetical protein